MSCQLVFLDKVEDCLKIVDWFVKLHKKSPVPGQYKLLALLLILLLFHKTQNGNWESKSSQVSTLPSPFQDYVQPIQGVLIFSLFFSCLEFPTTPNGLPITFEIVLLLYSNIPSCIRTTRHERWAISSTIFTSTNTTADKQETLGFQLLAASLWSKKMKKWNGDTVIIHFRHTLSNEKGYFEKVLF